MRLFLGQGVMTRDKDLEFGVTLPAPPSRGAMTNRAEGFPAGERARAAGIAGGTLSNRSATHSRGVEIGGDLPRDPNSVEPDAFCGGYDARRSARERRGLPLGGRSPGPPMSMGA